MPSNSEANYNEFSDSRLVDIYDIVNPLGEETRFYVELAVSRHVSKICDIGCGTGLLSYEFIRRGIEIIGADPFEPMLNKAKQRYSGNLATWLLGNSEQISHAQADMAIMTGHVAQFYLDENDWNRNLGALHTALKPNAILAFESRNPNVTPFQDWPSTASHRRLTAPGIEDIEWWAENFATAGNKIKYEIHYLFTKSKQEIVSVNELIFRTYDDLVHSLAENGFKVENVYGNWNKNILQADSPEMIFVAKRL